MRKLNCLALFGIFCFAAARSNAQAAALLVAADASELSEVQLAKVVADESSLWLSVRLQGRTRLALVAAESSVEAAPAADDWLRALDFATRVRVGPPPGPLAACGSLQPFALADTGVPEPQRVVAFEVSSANSEIELRRALADVGLNPDVSRIAEFTNDARPPFRISLYDIPTLGGSTEAIRLLDAGHSDELPRIAVSSKAAVPLSLIILAKDGVQLLAQESADASEFPVIYRAADASCDYLSARRGWLAQNPTRWLNEVQASAALFSDTVLSANSQLESAISRYFGARPEPSAHGCEEQVRAAHARASLRREDFTCDESDDLSRTLTEVGFDELRLSRFFGTLTAAGAKLRVVNGQSRSPLLLATDFDASDCPSVSPPANAPVTPMKPPPHDISPVMVSDPEEPYYSATPPVNTAAHGEESCTFSVSDSNSDDSCTGDANSAESTADSCSGDSSPSDSGPDSCSGDSSNSGSDSCSGDSDSSSDSAGCGKSEYDGDTCSGDSADANSTRTKSAALRASGTATGRHLPQHRVRLSVLTLLAAALGLPLRRLRASR